MILPDPLEWLLTALLPDIAAGFLGALATLFLVERRVEQLGKQDLRRRTRAVLPEVLPAILGLIDVVALVMKASAPAGSWPVDRPAPRSLGELLTEENARALEWFDPASHEGDERENWAWAVTLRLAPIDRILSESAHGFGSVYDTEFLELLQAVRHDEYLRVLKRLHEDVARADSAQVVSLCGLVRQRRKSIGRLLALAEGYESRMEVKLSPPQFFAADDQKPPRGVARAQRLPVGC